MSTLYLPCRNELTDSPSLARISSTFFFKTKCAELSDNSAQGGMAHFDLVFTLSKWWTWQPVARNFYFVFKTKCAELSDNSAQGGIAYSVLVYLP